MADRPAKLGQIDSSAPAPTTGVPRWVKVFGAVALALLLLLVLAQLVGGGKHGPGRHTGSAAATSAAQVVMVSGDHAPPAGAR